MKKENVDIEIYVSQIVRFFDKNPNELKILIGDLDKAIFYQRIKNRATENHLNGEDVSLTRSQMIDIVVQMHREKEESKIKKNLYMSHYMGNICLN